MPRPLPESPLRVWPRPYQAPARLPPRGRFLPAHGTPRPDPAGVGRRGGRSRGSWPPWPAAPEEEDGAAASPWPVAPDEDEATVARPWKTSATLTFPPRSGVSRSIILFLSNMSSGARRRQKRGRGCRRLPPPTHRRHAEDQPFHAFGRLLSAAIIFGVGVIRTVPVFASHAHARVLDLFIVTGHPFEPWGFRLQLPSSSRVTVTYSSSLCFSVGRLLPVSSSDRWTTGGSFASTS